MTLYGIIAMVLGFLAGMAILKYKMEIENLTKRNKELDKELTEKKNRITSLERINNRVKDELNTRKQNVRKGIYKSSGWHYTKDAEENPNSYTKWDMYFTVQELGERTKDKTKVKILDYYTSDGVQKSSIEWYNKWLNDNHGGFVKTNLIEWVETKTKSEKRNDRLDDVLN